MRREEQLHNPQPRFRSHGRKHIGVLRHAFPALLGCAALHISMFAEIWMSVNMILPFLSEDKERCIITSRRGGVVTRLFVADSEPPPLSANPGPYGHSTVAAEPAALS